MLGEKGDETTLTITVTAANKKTKKDYTVTVTRLFNDDATLASLDVNPGSKLDPPFDGADVSVYTSDVAFDVEEVTLTWEPSDAFATAEPSAPDADPDTDGHQIGLEEEGEATDYRDHRHCRESGQHAGVHAQGVPGKGPPGARTPR